ncbi:unnamed protein product [Brachionus calyciflorus]|uniref:SWIM-type domain-containing protein n=1 Tax=Brachionus calyciflorus TaxID=104777 RepID=A0A814IFN1_9BILA|nr:unnamed protein product [Brachionus calyciflorus]
MEDIFDLEFGTYDELKNTLFDWSEKFFQPINIRSSTKLKANFDDQIINKFVYESIYYKCHHSGKPRSNKIDNSRPSQKTECIESELLVKAETPTFEAKKILKTNYDINLTCKAINNLSQKFAVEAKQGRAEDEIIQDYLDDLKQSDPNNSIELKLTMNSENVETILDCIFIQLNSMKQWYKNYPEIIHIDTTFNLNLEKFDLLTMLAQDSNLKGVPIAYCFIRSETNENLNWIYSTFSKYNDIIKNKVIMVDKDLSNIDILERVFICSRILLCTFHALKYIKTKINAEKVEMKKKEKIMGIFRKILYSETEASADKYTIKLKNNTSDEFNKYFEKNWLNCKQMWMKFYRSNLSNFDTDTNNHIESFHALVKKRLSRTKHLSESIESLIHLTEEKIQNDVNSIFSLKLKKWSSNDCNFVKLFAVGLSDEAVSLIRDQHLITLKTKYKVQEKNEDHYTFKSINSQEINDVSFNHIKQLSCNCIFFQNYMGLPCSHKVYFYENIYSFDVLEKKSNENSIDSIVVVLSRWLKTHQAKVNLESYTENHVQMNITKSQTKQLDTREKYAKIKPLAESFVKRAISTGTKEFNRQYEFLQKSVNSMNNNSFDQIYFKVMNDSEIKQDKPFLIEKTKQNKTPIQKLKENIQRKVKNRVDDTSDVSVIEDLNGPEEKIYIDSRIKLLQKFSLKNDAWLSNYDINKYLWVLKNKFIELKGLCDPNKFEYEKFIGMILTEHMFVYNNGCHWILLYKKNDWYMFYSLNQSQTSCIEFFKFIYPNEKEIVLFQQKVQQQKGSTDCGLFVCAFITSLAFKIEPNSYEFIQNKLRDHFVNSIKTNTISLFPGFPEREKEINYEKTILKLNSVSNSI